MVGVKFGKALFIKRDDPVQHKSGSTECVSSKVTSCRYPENLLRNPRAYEGGNK